MKNIYEELRITILMLCSDIVTANGSGEGDPYDDEYKDPNIFGN